MHTIISNTSLICKVCFSIDISRQYGVLKMHEEMRWANTKVSLPAHVSQFNQVYIIWGYTSLSWQEGNRKCRQLDGFLPSITTKEETDFLEKVVLGKFTPRQLSIHLCRSLSVICSFFMGLDSRLVSVHIYILILLNSKGIGLMDDHWGRQDGLDMII